MSGSSASSRAGRGRTGLPHSSACSQQPFDHMPFAINDVDTIVRRHDGAALLIAVEQQHEYWDSIAQSIADLSPSGPTMLWFWAPH